VAKSTREIHHKLEGEDRSQVRGRPTFRNVLLQILMLDIVFSLDSVITAVGMVDRISIMIAAVVVAVSIMLISAKAIGDFVDRHPTVKMLALSFLLLIGVTLIAEGFEQHISKGYIYFAMGFSVFVEMLNLRLQKTRLEPVHLHESVRLESARP
jgi:predicted tellurium resistance membrane protein TerC